MKFWICSIFRRRLDIIGKPKVYISKSYFTDFLGRTEEVVGVIHVLGRMRHNSLVPLEAFYAGSKGEKLLVHPFYGYGNLSRFIIGNSVLLLPCFCFRLCF